MRKLLFLLFLLSALCATSAWAEIKTVCASGCDYTLSHEGIDLCLSELTGSYDTCELRAATSGGTATVHIDDSEDDYLTIPGSLTVTPTLRARTEDTIIIDGLKSLAGFTGTGPYAVAHTPYPGSNGPHFVVWNDNPIPRTTNSQDAPDPGEWGWVSNVLYVGSDPSLQTVQVSDRLYLLDAVKAGSTIKGITWQYANAALLLRNKNIAVYDCDFNYFKGSQTIMLGQYGTTSQDYMCSDARGAWTKSAGGTLGYSSPDEFYTMASTADNYTIYKSATLGNGNDYVCWVDAMNGTASGATYEIVVLNTGTVQEDKKSSKTTTSQYVRHWYQFTAETGNNGVGLRLPTSLGGQNIKINSWQCNQVMKGYDLQRLIFYQGGQNAVKFRWAVQDSQFEDIDISWSNAWFALTGSSNSIHGLHLYNYSSNNVMNRINVYGIDELIAGSAGVKIQGGNYNIITYSRLGPYLGDTFVISPGSYNKVYNNTLYRSSHEASHPLITLGNGYDVDMCDDCGEASSGQSCGVKSTYNEIINNIIYQVRTNNKGFILTTCSGDAPDPGVDDTNVIDYNQIYGVITDSSNTNWVRWFEDGMGSCDGGKDYSSWQSTYPLSDPGTYQTHGAWGDPLMTNPASRQFWPTSSSPCKDAGYNTGYPDVLYPALNSGPVHQGLIYDMGAYRIDNELEFYCLRNDGGSGSKVVVTDCGNAANCINETVHNAASFTVGDLIGICPNGGPFNSQIIPPSSGADRQEITYRPFYSSLYGWPILDEGLKVDTSYIKFGPAEIRPGIAEAAEKSFEGGRFADGGRNWQAAEETPVTGWSVDKTGVFAVGIGSVGGAVGNVTPQLYFRNKTDSGSFAAVGAATEVKYTTVSGLTDESNVTSGEAGVISGKTYETDTGCVTCEQEDSHQATSATSLADDEWVELQVGISFANADGTNKDEYEFALYEGGTQVGPASLATVSVDDYSDILLWVNFENYSAPQSYTLHGINEYSAGDTTLSFSDNAAINDNVVINGSYTLDIPGDVGSYVALDNDATGVIVHGSAGRIGLAWKVTTWNGTDMIFRAKDSSGSNYIAIQQFNPDEVRALWVVGGIQQALCTTTDADLGSGPNYIELEYDVDDGGEIFKIYVDGTLKCSSTASKSPITFGDGTDDVKFGTYSTTGGPNDYALDQIRTSNDHTRNFNALKDLTNYPG